MTSEQFTYWLQGYLEVANPSNLGKKEIQIIQDHLDLVFTKVTPERVKTVSEIIDKAQKKNNKKIFPSLEFDNNWPHGNSIHNNGLICKSDNTVVYC